jgi:hypothetical protein
MPGLSKFLPAGAGEAFKSARGRVELALVAVCLAGWPASLALHSRPGGTVAWLVGLVVSASVLLLDALMLTPRRRIRELPSRPSQPRESPLELRIPDLDLDIVQGLRCSCEVRVLNRGPEAVSGVRVELTDVDERLRFQGMRLPHELTEPPARSPLLQILGSIDNRPEPAIKPGTQVTRVGLATVLVGRPLFPEKSEPPDERIFCAFTGTRRLIDMTDLTPGREYVLRVKVTGREVPAKESAFVMRVTNRDRPRYRVMFRECGNPAGAGQGGRGLSAPLPRPDHTRA